MKNCFLLLFSFLIVEGILAQENLNKDIFTTSIRYHYGKVLPHHKTINTLVNDQIQGIEFNFGIIPSLEKKWSEIYNQPEFGLGFYHGSLGNKNVLGSTSALFPYINFNIKEIGIVNMSLQTGLGFAFTRNNYHPENNNTNIAIGSHLNAYFKLQFINSISITKNWLAEVGIGFHHLSNGAIKLPNKGLNMATANIGVKYNFKEVIRTKIKTSPALALENELSVIFNGGTKQASDSDRQKYFTSSISTNYTFGISAKQKLGFGIDLFYDEAIGKKNANAKSKTNFNDRISQSFFISHDLVIQKFSIITHIGVYTLYGMKPPKPLYSRVGLRYQVSNKIIANLSLKAHVGKADFIEWGIGYRFSNLKKN